MFSSKNSRPFEAKFHMEPQFDVGIKTCSNVPGHMTKMVKTFKNLLLRYQETDDLETWNTALGTQVLPICSKDDTGLTLTFL